MPVGVTQTDAIQGDSLVLTRSLFLSVERLNAYDGWKPSARRYIAENSDRNGVDIVAAVTGYWGKVAAFYTWFAARQTEIHAEAFERLMQKEAKLALFGLNTDLSVSINDLDAQYSARDIFSNILSVDELEEVAGLVSNPDAAVSRIIELLDEHCDVTEELTANIRQLFLTTPFLSRAFAE